MGRYYLIATVIVVVAGSIVFAGRQAAMRDWDVRATPRPGMTPTQTRGFGGPTPRPAATFTGDGPWAMSALPSCFNEIKTVRGAAAAIHDLPKAADRFPAGATLNWGNCRLRVLPDELLIARGTDVLRVPPSASLFHGANGSIVLLWRQRRLLEVRTYTQR